MRETVSIKRNLVFQTIYQITETCIPLITSPYLSRVLGAPQLGVFSFTTSVAAYFVLFAVLGKYNHGTRSIAACGDDIEKRSKTFWSVLSLHAATSMLCLCAYAVYLVFFCKENHLIATIQTIELIRCLISVSWLFAGMEMIQLTATRSLVIRILSVVLIILLVKQPTDLWIYALITVGGTFVSQLILWIYVPRYVKFVKVSWKDAASHLKASLLLFVPLLAMSVYHVMDKTMLGLISNYEQSGYYYNADKIVNIMVGIVSGFSTVMLPRMSAMISQGRKEESDNLFRASLEGTVLAGSAIAFGIAAIAYEFVPFFFGPGYEECINLTVILAPVLIIKSFSFTARFQFLVPRHRERAYISSVISGAVVNLIANCLLIPRLGAMGAVIGTLLAELIACIVQYAVIGKMIRMKETLLRTLVYMAFGVLMLTAVRGVAGLPINLYVKIAAEVLTGAVIYIGLCACYCRITQNDIWENVFAVYFRRFTR